MSMRAAILMVVVVTSGCRGAFADKPKVHREDATSRCGPQTSEIVESPIDQTVAWRSGPHVVCWQRPNGVAWKELDVAPAPDRRGLLTFTSDGRALTYTALATDRVIDRAIDVRIDVETGATVFSR